MSSNIAEERIKKLCDLAAAEVGVKESPSNSDNVKYNTEYYGKVVKSTASTKYYWCVVFIWWLFKKTGLSDLFYGGGKTASCASVKSYAQKHGQWVTHGYRKGDLLLFNFSNGTAPKHIGLCIDATASKVTSIDGNTSAGDSGSQDNGGMVNIRTRKLATVVGAYRPNYGGAQASAINPYKVPTIALKYGSTNREAVKWLQWELNQHGYACDIDGSFGPATDRLVRKFQKDRGLVVDGSVGPATRAALLK